MLMVATETQTLQPKVAQSLEDFWEFYTGVRLGRATALIDQQSISVLLEGVLTPPNNR